MTIPASEFVNVIPSVLEAGGNPLALNAVFETQDTSIPIGTVMAFASLADVQAWFGAGSTEAQLAAIYFGGFSGATLLPGRIYFQQYANANVGAYLRSGRLGLTLTQLQALSGTIICTVDGVSSTSLSINLASASSFSNAAALIQTGVQGGTPSSTATVTYDSLRDAFVIHSSTTGASSTIGFATGTLAAGIKLQAAQGAVTSQGQVATTPAAQLATLTTLTQNWATLMTVWEPDTAGKVAWATAINALSQRYVYVGWDTDSAPAAGDAPTSFARLTATMNGRVAIWGLSGITGAMAKAAWFCGATASINFDDTNGRITYAYKSQAGLVADVTNTTVYNTLLANDYNAFVAVATANDDFVFFQNGSISGDWDWADTFVNQIKLNSNIQLALLVYLAGVNSVPYNQQGYDSIRSVVNEPCRQFIDFGGIVRGVTLSASQRVEINTAAGFPNAASTVESQGFFLKITDATPVTRGLRASPPMTLWYADGGSIQKLNLASVAVQ
jgi:hypothetical protein